MCRRHFQLDIHSISASVTKHPPQIATYPIPSTKPYNNQPTMHSSNTPYQNQLYHSQPIHHLTSSISSFHIIQSPHNILLPHLRKTRSFMTIQPSHALEAMSHSQQRSGVNPPAHQKTQLRPSKPVISGFRPAESDESKQKHQNPVSSKSPISFLSTPIFIQKKEPTYPKYLIQKLQKIRIIPQHLRSITKLGSQNVNKNPFHLPFLTTNTTKQDKVFSQYRTHHQQTPPTNLAPQRHPTIDKTSSESEPFGDAASLEPQKNRKRFKSLPRQTKIIEKVCPWA